MPVSKELKSGRSFAPVTPLLFIVAIATISGCSSNQLKHKPVLQELDTKTVPHVAREDRFDPWVYCGGKGAYACAAVTPKTDYVPPAKTEMSDFMKGVSEDLAAQANVTPAAVVAAPAPAFQNVLFDFDKSALTGRGQQLLDRYLPDFAKKKIELRGFTDYVGGESYNNRLAVLRAENVKKFLTSKGIPGEFITIAGDGLCCYVAPNDSEESRQLNRRVEIHLKAD